MKYKPGDKIIITRHVNDKPYKGMEVGKEYTIKSNYIEAGYKGNDYENWYCLNETQFGIHEKNFKLIEEKKEGPKVAVKNNDGDKGWGF